MEAVFSALIPAIVESVFGALTEAVGLSDWLRQRLGRDPEKLAFHQALTQALTDSATHYPGRNLRYFAEILRDLGGPLLARTLQPAAPLPTADELTTVWLNHLTVDSLIHYRAEFTQFATYFLERLQFHLENQQPLQWIIQARRQRSSEEAIRRMADAAEQNVTNIEALGQEVARLMATLATVLQTSSSSTVATGGGAYNAGTISAQNFAGRDLTINQYFVVGLARLVFNYSARIENFLYEYLGSKEKRVPFGGRQAQIDQLNTWLDTPDTPPYLLIVAEAGGGKSALVTRWCAQLATRTYLDVIFVPISIRFQTAAQDVAFAALAARLAQIYEQQSTLPAALSAEQWKGQCETYLRLPLPAGKRLLVVIDGLDEATGWEAGPELFAKRPPAGLRILATARVRAKEVDADRWAARLGWQDEQIARKLHLPGLDRRGIEEALVSMGNPLGHLATQVDLVGELYRLSQGDPLLVHLYVEALQAMGATVARLRLEDLAAIEPGLDGFMERWWDDQRKQWRMQGKDPFAEEERLLPLLHACTVACGPLLLNDLAELDKQHFDKGLLVTHMAELLGRWVIGDGRKQGYVFNHPRLRDYFGGYLNPDEQREWQAKFCAWGERVLTALNAGTLDPKQTPEYLLRYYSTHLERSHALPEAFYTLISNGWRMAWEWLDVSNSGFLGDLARVWECAKEAYAQTTERSNHLIIQVKIILCKTSVISLGSKLSPELLIQSIQVGLRTPVQALAIAKSLTNEYQRAEALKALVSYLPDVLLPDVLAVAKEIKDNECRAIVLITIVPYLSDFQRSILINEVLGIAKNLDDPHGQIFVLSKLIPNLTPNQKHELIDEILSIANKISNPNRYPFVLISIIPYLSDIQCSYIISIAFNSIQTIEDEKFFSLALSSLAPYLSTELLTNAVAIAMTIKDEVQRALVLISLGVHLLDNLGSSAIDEAIRIARTIKDKSQSARILIALLSNSPFARQQNSIVSEALAACRQSFSTSERVRSLCALATYLPKPQQSIVIAEALAAAKAITDEEVGYRISHFFIDHLSEDERRKTFAQMSAYRDRDNRVGALTALFPFLSELERREAVEDAIMSTKMLRDKSKYVLALCSLASHLSPALLTEALELASEIEDEDRKTIALASLYPYLPQSALIYAVEIALAIGDDYRRADALCACVPHVSELFLSEILRLNKSIQIDSRRALLLAKLASRLVGELQADLFSEAEVLWNDSGDWNALNVLAPHLPMPKLVQTLKSVMNLTDEGCCARALGVLAPYFPEPQRNSILTLALRNVQLIQGEFGEYERAYTVRSFVQHLSEELLLTVLSKAREFLDDEARTLALFSFAPYVSVTQQRGVIIEAMMAARKIWDINSSALLIHTLDPCLPELIVTDALMVAWKTQNEFDRIRSLSVVTPLVRGRKIEIKQVDFSDFCDTLLILSEYPRWEFLDKLPALMPFILALAGDEAPQAAEGIYHAIQEVCGWWP